MYVASHSRWADVAHFDPTTGVLEEFRRGSDPSANGLTPHGHYVKLNGKLAVFFRFESTLRLLIGAECRDLDSGTADIRLERAVDGTWAKLTLLDHETPCEAIKYEPIPFGGPDDPTPMAEAEDGDFGLFIQNVLGDKGRRVRIYGGVEDES